MITLKMWVLFLIPVFALAQSVDYSINNETLLTSMMDDVRASNIEASIRRMSSFKTRFYLDAEASISQAVLRDEWRVLAGDRSDIKVEFYHHTFPEYAKPGPGELAMPSVILTIDGSEFPDDIIVIGGHADSVAYEVRDFPKGKPYPRRTLQALLGIQPQEIDDGDGDTVQVRFVLDEAPGADDNASGIAVITEIIRILMAHDYRPKRTMKFIAYSAEEVRTSGSDEIARGHQESGDNVIGVLNLDMTNFKGSDDLDLTILDDYTNPEQNAFLGELIDRYLPWAEWEYTSCGYPCSDHGPWNAVGFRASMLAAARFGEHNQSIHTLGDTIDKSGGHAENSVKFVQMGLAFLIELDR